LDNRTIGNLGGNITIYGNQPSDTAEVLFEAWIDRVQYAIFAVNDSILDGGNTVVTFPGTNSTVTALKTISVLPGDHQLYLRIINPTDQFFWFGGVEYVLYHLFEFY
jgi:hypothetical protein